MKKILGLILLLILTGCANTMKPTDFKDQKPRLIIEDYLSGNVKAWGVLQNRSGKVTRQFSADLNGTWDGKQLILKEKFNFDLISDPEEKICKQYDVIKEKSMYGKKYMGIERSTFLINSKGKLVKEKKSIHMKRLRTIHH